MINMAAVPSYLRVFLPVIRTFAPIIAGIVNMDRKKFGFYNIVGCIAWTTSMLAGGHYLQKFFLETFNYDLKEHLEIIVLGIVLGYYCSRTL